MTDKKTAGGEALSFLVRNIKVPYTEPLESAVSLGEQKLIRLLGRNNRPAIEGAKLYKTSVDARKKPDIAYVCTVLVTARCRRGAAEQAAKESPDLSLFEEEDFSIPHGDETMAEQPVIVGFGPAGMFSALLLAEQGFKPVIIERGDDIDARTAAVEQFYRTKILDPDSNIQFGAGGAGTFSDGKLMTRIGDPKCSYILRRFVEFGAPENILIKAKPHVGTDVLLHVVTALRAHLASLGCTFHFRTTMREILYKAAADGSRRAYAVRTDGGDSPCGAVLLALGHSARDTHKMLFESGMTVLPKPFSVGVRIEHLQSAINEAAYGAAARATAACGAVGSGILLPPAEYAVSFREKAISGGEEPRGVYSFCMCPGGEVMAAASETGGVVVNGMSRSGRDGVNANAALAVSVRPSDYGNTPMAAIGFQRALEQKAFLAGGADYAAPAQTVGDFLTGKHGTRPTTVQPSYMNGHVAMCDLHEILPGFVSAMLETGIRVFERQLPGFSSDAAVLTGVETRTSSPVRLLRGETYLAEHTDNIYPVGEGAGYAGGITSAAADGLNAALALMKRYRPKD
ncbi:MAG: hypothetical protein MJ175_02330 [Clostridia bacterium]|nr:hypothetical protein [Clostridia bacterium]